MVWRTEPLSPAAGAERPPAAIATLLGCVWAPGVAAAACKAALARRGGPEAPEPLCTTGKINARLNFPDSPGLRGAAAPTCTSKDHQALARQRGPQL